MADNTQPKQDVDTTEDELDEMEELLLELVDSVIARLQATPTKEKVDDAAT